MRASTTSSARTAWLSLVAGVLAIAMWGATLLTAAQPSLELSQRPHLDVLLADGGGTKPTG